MEKIIFRLVVLTSACCLSARHVHVERELNWSEAREYCRNHYTDLSRLSNRQEEDLFMKTVSPNDEGWIGVYWNQTTDTWRWSGGENVTFWKTLYTYMNPSELQKQPSHNHNIYWTKDNWLTRIGTNNHKFFCLSLTVVQEEKTWEEALELCRQKHAELSSLLSEVENLLAINEILKTNITDPVWIGLRYFGDEWLWMNGYHLVYKNWSQGGAQDHQCPAKNSCGALTRGGVWENRDCREQLSFICG